MKLGQAAVGREGFFTALNTATLAVQDVRDDIPKLLRPVSLVIIRDIGQVVKRSAAAS